MPAFYVCDSQYGQHERASKFDMDELFLSYLNVKLINLISHYVVIVSIVRLTNSTINVTVTTQNGRNKCINKH